MEQVLTEHYYHPVTKQFDVFGLLSGNNIFLTLTCLFLVFTLIEKIQLSKEGKWKYVLLLLPLVLFTCLTEGGIYLLPLAIIFAWTRNKKSAVVGILVVSSLLLLCKSLFSYLSVTHDYQSLYQHLTYDNQFMWILAVPLILCYNGQRGGKGANWEKELFYLVYPLHLSLIYLVEYFIK